MANKKKKTTKVVETPVVEQEVVATEAASVVEADVPNPPTEEVDVNVEMAGEVDESGVSTEIVGIAIGEFAFETLEEAGDIIETLITNAVQQDDKLAAAIDELKVANYDKKKAEKQVVTLTQEAKVTAKTIESLESVKLGLQNDLAEAQAETTRYKETAELVETNLKSSVATIEAIYNRGFFARLFNTKVQ